MVNTAEEVHPGRLFPVCCAADREGYENQIYKDQLSCAFVFVESLTETYTEETEIGSFEEDNKIITSPNSPFKNRTPKECHQLLIQLRRNTVSDVNYETFVIMDDSSLRDDTVLLVAGPRLGEEGDVQSVRGEFQIAHWRLLGYDMAEMDLGEDRIVAEGTDDGVLRASVV